MVGASSLGSPLLAKVTGPVRRMQSLQNWLLLSAERTETQTTRTAARGENANDAQARNGTAGHRTALVFRGWRGDPHVRVQVRRGRRRGGGGGHGPGVRARTSGPGLSAWTGIGLSRQPGGDHGRAAGSPHPAGGGRRLLGGPVRWRHPRRAVAVG